MAGTSDRDPLALDDLEAQPVLRLTPWTACAFILVTALVSGCLDQPADPQALEADSTSTAPAAGLPLLEAVVDSAGLGASGPEPALPDSGTAADSAPPAPTDTADSSGNSSQASGSDPTPPAASTDVADGAPDSSGQANAEGESLVDAIDAPQLRYIGFRLFWTILVITATALFIRAMAYVFETLAERNAERRLFYKRLVPLGRLASWILAVWIVAWIVWAVDTQGLVAAGAAGAVAIGFASQDVLKNVFGGLVIIFDRPFQAGDKIKVGETYGEVVSVGLWSTRITTPDDNLVSVPNSQVVSGQVANANAGALDCQVVTSLYLPGWVDERKAKQIAYQAAAASPYVYLKKPIVVLVLDEFKEIFVTHLKVKAYVLDTRFEFLLMSDITERAREEFRRHGLIGPGYDVRPVRNVVIDDSRAPTSTDPS